jgi:hypothetical protein
LKFILLVEGETERVALPMFIERWLDPRLQQRVGVKPVMLRGSGRFVKEVAEMVNDQLNSPGRNDIVAVIGLLDLYGLPADFFPPGLSDAQARYDWAKEKLEGMVGQTKFRQFFAVHELEAWLLSDPGIFHSDVRNEFPASVKNPESVDFNQPPAQLLEKIYRKKLERPYRKVVDGRNLFGKLNPEIACKKCPRLKEMFEEMLRLANNTGN